MEPPRFGLLLPPLPLGLELMTFFALDLVYSILFRVRHKFSIIEEEVSRTFGDFLKILPLDIFLGFR